VPGVAAHRVELSAAAESRRGWFGNVEARHLGRIAVDDANTAFSPAHELVDVRFGHLGVRAGALRLAPFLGVTNLLDVEYNAAVAVNAFGQRFYEPGPGRALYLGGSASLR